MKLCFVWFYTSSVQVDLIKVLVRIQANVKAKGEAPAQCVKNTHSADIWRALWRWLNQPIRFRQSFTNKWFIDWWPTVSIRRSTKFGKVIPSLCGFLVTRIQSTISKMNFFNSAFVLFLVLFLHQFISIRAPATDHTRVSPGHLLPLNFHGSAPPVALPVALPVAPPVAPTDPQTPKEQKDRQHLFSQFRGFVGLRTPTEPNDRNAEPWPKPDWWFFIFPLVRFWMPWNNRTSACGWVSSFSSSFSKLFCSSAIFALNPWIFLPIGDPQSTKTRWGPSDCSCVSIGGLPSHPFCVWKCFLPSLNSNKKLISVHQFIPLFEQN